MIRAFPARIEIPAVSIGTEEILRLHNINKRKERVNFAHQKCMENMAINEIALLLHFSVKIVQKYLMLNPDEVDEARLLTQKNVFIEEINKTMHHTYKTIQRYLSPDYSVKNGHYNAPIPEKLAPYKAEGIKLRSEGITYPNIHRIITEKGYKGSVANEESIGIKFHNSSFITKDHGIKRSTSYTSFLLVHL